MDVLRVDQNHSCTASILQSLQLRTILSKLQLVNNNLDDMFSATMPPNHEGWLRKREKRIEDKGREMYSKMKKFNRKDQDFISVPKGPTGSGCYGAKLHVTGFAAENPHKRKPKQASASKSSSARNKSSHEAAPARSPSSHRRASRNPSQTGGQRAPSRSTLVAEDANGQPPPVRVDAYDASAVQPDLIDDPLDENTHEQEPDARRVSPV